MSKAIMCKALRFAFFVALIQGCSSTEKEAPSVTSDADVSTDVRSDTARDMGTPDGKEPIDSALDSNPVIDATTADIIDSDSQSETSATDSPATVEDSVADISNPDSPSACEPGVICVNAFPFHYDGDTSKTGESKFSSYACAPSKPEGGREHIFKVTVPEDGFLSAAVYDTTNDVDVHILQKLDPSTCVSRGDKHSKADVSKGVWYVVVDSYGSGSAGEGAYGVDIGFIAPSKGPCAMKTGVMPRVNDGGNSLPMPATGPVVMEAHLVTQEEPAPYPATATDELEAHKKLSQSKTGFVMYRTQVWAPLEGGSFYGAGISDPKFFPVIDESYYVNMYWQSSSRPTRGTRMILRKPGTTRAVVVAAGYETGPGNLSNIGGTTEETHFYLDTTHQSTLTLGLSVDNSLPFGPRVCTD